MTQILALQTLDSASEESANVCLSSSWSWWSHVTA